MDPFIQGYLERLGARLDAYTNAITSLTEKLDAHVVNTPTIVHNPLSPTTSPESTTDASAHVPDVSCSTTKAQEIPTVAHDATPICIPMVPVTCSTECSSQVDAIHSVDEVHDAAIVAAEVRNIATALGPELAVDICNSMAAVGVATYGHHNKFDGLNIPVKASISPPPHIQDPFPNYSTISNRRAAVVGTDEYTLVEATPDIAIKLAVLPGVSSFMNKAHEASAVLHAAAPMLVTDLLLSGTDAVDSMQLFRNHDLDVPPPMWYEGLMLRLTLWPSFWMHLAHQNEVRPMPWPSFSCSREGMTLNHKGLLPQATWVMNNLLDRGCIDFTLGRAALPRFCIDNSTYTFAKQIGDLLGRRPRMMVKHSGSLQPLSSRAKVPYWFDYFIGRSPQIPQARYCQLEKELKPSWLLNYLFVVLNSWSTFSWYLPRVQQVKPSIFLKVVCRIRMVPIDILIPSQPIMHLMNDLNLGASRWQSVMCSVQPSYEFRPQVNPITSLIVVHCCDLIPTEEYFSCLQNAQLQSWCSPAGRTYTDKWSSQKGSEGIECSDILLIILQCINDCLAEIMLNEIALQLAIHCKEIGIAGELLGNSIFPVSSVEHQPCNFGQLIFLVLTGLSD